MTPDLAALQAVGLDHRRQLLGQEIDEHAHRRQQSAARWEHRVADALGQASSRARPLPVRHCGPNRRRWIPAARRCPGPARAAAISTGKSWVIRIGWMSTCCDGIVRAVQGPALPRLVLAHAQGGMRAEIRGSGRTSAALEVGRAGDQQFVESGRSFAPPVRHRRRACCARAGRRRSLPGLCRRGGC